MPLTDEVQLSDLFSLTQPGELLGVWIRARPERLEIQGTGKYAGRRLLAGDDLGYLIGRCSRIVLRTVSEPVVLEAEEVIRWRTLQVVTATPYLPDLEQLKARFPGIQLTPAGLRVPIRAWSPEAFLAECLAHGIQVTRSDVVYCSVAPV